MREKLSAGYVRNALAHRKELLLGRLLEPCSDPVREAVGRLRRELRAAKISRRNLRKFDAVRGRQGIKLNLGCGGDIREGWVNVDLKLDDAPEADGFFNYDLRRGIPLPDGSCSLIYSSHFFEHLTNAEGQTLMRECLRVLEDGGVMRTALPNYRPSFAAYLADNWDYVTSWDYLPVLVEENGERCWGEVMDVGIYQFGEHVSYYDEERAVRVLGKIGFSSVSASEFKPGIDVDTEERRRYSFYVEAVK